MRRRSAWRAVVVAAATGFLLSCAGANLWTDWTSISTGHSNRGRLRRPAKMPIAGPGFTVPERWRDRGVLYGVEELIVAVQGAAHAVYGASGGALLGVADLSPLRGGRSRWHRSHQSGRDIDLLFYTVDEDGASLPPPEEDMIHFDLEGKAYAPKREVYDEEGWERRRFDPARNWALLEALLGDPTIRVQWVFVSDPLRQMLLDHAVAAERPTWAIEYARVVLRQPADAPPHDDHFHLRIYCSRSDRFHGCVDRGPVWHHEKKSLKYGGAERYDPLLWRIAATAPFLAGIH